VPRDTSVTFRVDGDVLTWARARAFFGGSSLNAIVRRFLEEYAAVPARWMDGLPPPWTPENRIVQVVDPIGAGHRAAGRAHAELLDAAIAEALSVARAASEVGRAEDDGRAPPPRRG
jgi:hypothetical protein